MFVRLFFSPEEMVLNLSHLVSMENSEADPQRHASPIGKQ